MSQLFSNNIDTTLAATISDSATSATLTDGSKLKSPSGVTFELLTLMASGVVEVVRVTARSGNTVTITRAQEGTTAQAWAAGTRVFAGVTAGTLAALLQNLATGSNAIALGPSSRALGISSVAYGRSALADHNQSLALGYFAFADAEDTVAVGYSANAYAVRSTAVGRSVNVNDLESVAIGRSLTSYGIKSILLGDGGYCEAAKGTGIGHDAYVGGEDGIAIGTRADVDWAQTGGIALGETTVITTRSLQAAAVPVVPRASGVEADAAWKQAGSASILCTGVLDLKTLQTYTITMPTGVTFFPEEVGVIITAASGVTLQPSVRFGATADEARYLAITQTAADAVHGRDRYTTLASAAGSSTLRAEVTTAATGTTLSGRVYWRGFAVVNAA